MSARVELIWCTTHLHEEACNDLKLAQWRYKKNKNRRLRFVPIFWAGYLRFTGQAFYLPLGWKASRPRGLNKLLVGKKTVQGFRCLRRYTAN